MEVDPCSYLCGIQDICKFCKYYVYAEFKISVNFASIMELIYNQTFMIYSICLYNHLKKKWSRVSFVRVWPEFSNF